MVLCSCKYGFTEKAYFKCAFSPWPMHCSFKYTSQIVSKQWHSKSIRSQESSSAEQSNAFLYSQSVHLCRQTGQGFLLIATNPNSCIRGLRRFATPLFLLHETANHRLNLFSFFSLDNTINRLPFGSNTESIYKI